MENYKTIYLPTRDERADARELERIINVWATDGASLHSVVPTVSEGFTAGYIILLKLKN